MGDTLGWQSPAPPTGTSAWYERLAPLSTDRWHVRCWMHDRHPDGEVIVSPGDHSGDFLLWDADVDAQDRPVLSISPAVRTGSPEVWFVELHGEDAHGPAVTLVAFDTPHLPPGTVVTDPVFFHMPVRSEQQVAAVRWWRNDAVVDQVYVRPDMRRSHLSIHVLYAASAFHQLHGWPGRLHSDGRRTVLGEALAEHLRATGRIAPLEHLLTPMDPPADA
ncbi:MAG: hypothetical protein RL330_1124 [Actinomycetota bacterium]|jgi:hypothetical protein